MIIKFKFYLWAANTMEYEDKEPLQTVEDIKEILKETNAFINSQDPKQPC